MSEEEVIEQALLAAAIIVEPELVPVAVAYIATKKASKTLYKGFKKAKKFF